MEKPEVEYLSITIAATCDLCGRRTDNAESEGWTTNSQYTKFQCSECQEAMMIDDNETRLRELFGIV